MRETRSRSSKRSSPRGDYGSRRNDKGRKTGDWGGWWWVVAILATASCARSGSPAPPPEAAAEATFVPFPLVPLGAQVDWKQRPDLTPEKVVLGRLLFFDPRLSADGSVSCASCHRPAHAFADRTPTSVGVGGRRGTRKSPTFVNAAFQHRIDQVFGWDGRTASLAEQSKAPIFNPDEMDNTAQGVANAVARVREYRERFQDVYRDAPNADLIGDAMGAYMATRVSGNSAVDRFEGGDKNALSAEAQTGRELFLGRAKCVACHFSWTYTSSQFHNLGIGWNGGAFVDPGRAVVTGNVTDTGAFKTPSLRDVAKRAPYMHDGSLATLRDVVDHYDAGGTVNPWLSDLLEPLGLSEKEKVALVAFLNALDGEGYDDPGPHTLPDELDEHVH